MTFYQFYIANLYDTLFLFINLLGKPELKERSIHVHSVAFTSIFNFITILSINVKSLLSLQFTFSMPPTLLQQIYDVSSLTCFKLLLFNLKCAFFFSLITSSSCLSILILFFLHWFSASWPKFSFLVYEYFLWEQINSTDKSNKSLLNL